jgi:hypothetical protein
MCQLVRVTTLISLSSGVPHQHMGVFALACGQYAPGITTKNVGHLPHLGLGATIADSRDPQHAAQSSKNAALLQKHGPHRALHPCQPSPHPLLLQRLQAHTGDPQQRTWKWSCGQACHAPDPGVLPARQHATMQP